MLTRYNKKTVTVITDDWAAVERLSDLPQQGRVAQGHQHELDPMWSC